MEKARHLIDRAIGRGKLKLETAVEQMGLTEPLLVLRYLDDSEKLKLTEANLYPVINIDRAVVALLTVRGKEKIKELSRFLNSYVNVEVMPDFFTKYVNLPHIRRDISTEEADFVIVFVTQVFGGEMREDNICYLDGDEVERWEERVGAYLRHNINKISMIRG